MCGGREARALLDCYKLKLSFPINPSISSTKIMQVAWEGYLFIKILR